MTANTIYLSGTPASWSVQREKEHLMAKRTDLNQKIIVDNLRRIGATVTCIHEVGKGCPDLLVGYRGRTFLIEVKQPGEGLTEAEAKFHRYWNGGELAIIDSPEAAINLVTMPNPSPTFIPWSEIDKI
jgi:hypothetical protein